METGPDIEQTVVLTVNGERREVSVDPTRTLLDVLRDDLDLTGAKKACDVGECGSCTVLLDGRGVMSCLLAVTRAVGKEVVTIEGLAPDGEGEGLHPLQEAFVERGAAQCGFCIPGMIMQAHALISRDQDDDRSRLLPRLSRNMCRCTGYAKILDAIGDAAERMRGAAPAMHSVSEDDEGPRFGKQDSIAHVTGASKYAADLKKEGMLHAKLLRSPHHHARIVGIDTSAAEAIPGVVAVLTAADVPRDATTMNCRPQMTLFAEDRVRFRGEAVAVVAAESERLAERALAAIEVEYEPLPAVFDPVEAMKADAPLVNPPYSNWMLATDLVHGDLEKGFAEADVVVEGVYETAAREHAPMEPEAALAYVDTDGRMVFHSPHHHIYSGQMWLAELLGVEKDRVRVICPPMGGNFGHRGEFIHPGAIALLVQRTERPVKIVYSRQESILGSGKSYSYHLTHRTGATRDGTITVVEAKVIANGGTWIAHPDEKRKGSGIKGMERFIPGPYIVPHARVTMYEVATNRPRSGPLRGTNVPDFAFAWESQIDMLAERLGMDPLELRIRNGLVKDSTAITGEPLDESVGARSTMEALREPYARALERAGTESPPAPWRRGVGIGSVWKLCGGARNDGAGGGWTGKDLGLTKAAVELRTDGGLHIFAGAVEKGQGISIALARVAAMELGIPVESVTLTLGDTLLAPYPTATSGQRTLFLVGGAVRNACSVLQTALDEVDPARSMSMAERAAALTARGLAAKYEGTFVFQTTDDARGPIFAYASQLVELDVHTETGEVKVRRVTYVADPGRVINQMTFEGQVEGGVVAGLGYALKEGFVPGESDTLKDYGLPIASDAPEVLDVLIVENPVSQGPFGAKGSAEITAAAGMAAVANGIAHALGTRVFTMPATPARVLDAIRQHQQEHAAPHGAV